MRILIDDKEVKDRMYPLPWYSDAVCYNFRCPDKQIYPDGIKDIKRPSYVETLVIACNLDDYYFISRMKNLTQLYIYTGENIKELSFLENLLKLRQLCVLGSHITTLEHLRKLIDRKYEIYKGSSEDEELQVRLTYGFEGICIMTDAYDSDATELIKDGISRDDIRVNQHLISYGYNIRKQREEMMRRRHEERIQKKCNTDGG
ncbi:MAG: hypothetical protein IJM27_02605 [Eubacterium sp.]|nr:hypothetical protein [Eubacterium sp.]